MFDLPEGTSSDIKATFVANGAVVRRFSPGWVVDRELLLHSAPVSGALAFDQDLHERVVCEARGLHVCCRQCCLARMQACVAHRQTFLFVLPFSEDRPLRWLGLLRNTGKCASAHFGGFRNLFCKLSGNLYSLATTP